MPGAAGQAALQARVSELEQQLAAERFKGALLSGQLAAAGALATPWPDDVPPGYGPAEFEATLRSKIEAFEDLDVETVACSAYPCIAVLSYTDLEVEGDWAAAPKEVLGPWLRASGEGVELRSAMKRSLKGDHVTELKLTLTAYDTSNADLAERMRHRLESLDEPLQLP